ncbi:MAG TPA: hypothetical protein VHO70_13570 [Chitinispirillaceae bacterium]|nr:hypothetical protein [Chitinispirillaceae bacterium]
MKRNTGLFTALGMTLSLITSSLAGTDFYGFLEEPVVSSVIGMGASGTATGMGGFTFYNPAGLSLKDKPFIAFDFTRLQNDLGRGYIETGWVFPTWFVGGSFQTQTVKDVQRTDITGIIDGAYAQNRGTMLSFLIGLKRERYSLAASLNGVQEVIGDYSSYGVSGSVGLLVNIVEDHITAGVSAIHAAGRHNTFLDKKEKLKSERFPATVRAGACIKDSLFQKFPTILSVDVVYNDNDEIVTVPVGIDFRILPPLSLRIGKRFNHPSDLFSMGFGLNWKNIAFDAAFVPYRLHSDAFLKRSVGLTYSLPSPRSSEKKNKEAKVKVKRTQKEDENMQIIPVETPVQPAPVPVSSVPSDTVKKEQTDTTTVADTLSTSSSVDSTNTTVSDSTQQSDAQKADSVPASIVPSTDTTASDTLSATDSSTSSPEVKSAVETQESAEDQTGKPDIDSSVVPVLVPRDSSKIQ